MKTYARLFLNYFSFVQYFFKFWLVKLLIDRMYRANSTWASFDIDLKNFKQVLLKNQYSLSMIYNNIIKKYLQNAINKTNIESVSGEIPNIEKRYFKLSFIGMYCKLTQKKIENFAKDFAIMPKLR